MRLKVLGIYAEGSWVRTDFFYVVRLWKGHPTRKISLLNLYSKLKTRVLPPLEVNNKRQKINTYSTTSDNPIFIHIQWKFSSKFWLGFENLKNYRQYDKI